MVEDLAEDVGAARSSVAQVEAGEVGLVERGEGPGHDRGRQSETPSTRAVADGPVVAPDRPVGRDRGSGVVSCSWGPR